MKLLIMKYYEYYENYEYYEIIKKISVLQFWGKC